MPLLYVNDLAAGAHLAMDTAVDQRIKDAIDRLLARQGSNGSFGLWSAGGDDAWLDAYVTDFLTRAREKGFAVPDVLFKNALDRIRNSVVNANEPEKDGGRDLAYGLYVLARNGAAPIGDLRYLADTKLDNLATPIAKSQLAAALALVGDKAQGGAGLWRSARSAGAEAGARVRPGRLRLGAARCRGTGVARQRRQRAAGDADAGGAAGRSGARADALHLDPGECLAGAGRAGAGQGDADARYRRAAESRPRSIAATRPRRWRASRSRSPTPAMRRCRRWSRCRGSPVTPEPAASNGFKIERNYFTLDGKPADISKAKQNDRFAVVLKVTEAKPEFGHIMVSDYLPAGLEIDNPHLVSSGDTGTLDWIEDGEEPENTEFRDDRFTAAIDRASDDKAVFTVAYVVRAVSPGKYVLPQAYVEDMYNPSRYGRSGTGTVEVRSAK